MKRTYKIVAILSAFTWLFLFSIAPVLADQSATNTGTGFNSVNVVDADFDKITEINDDNFGDITNFANLFSCTGNNSCQNGEESNECGCESECGCENECNECGNECGCENESGEANIATGDINIEGNLENEINFSEIELQAELEGDVTAENSCTGAESDNVATADVENEIDLSNVNMADIENEVNIIANTGSNSASNEVCETCNEEEVSPIEDPSGDIDADVNIENTANTASIDFDGGSADFSTIALNQSTGAFSANVADVELENEISVINFNMSDLENEVDIFASTGNCELTNSCGGGTVGTGDIDADVDIENELNNAEADVSFTAPEEILVKNIQTGCNSDNVAALDMDNDIAVVNINDADVENEVNMLLSTGGNTIDTDDGDSETSSGDIDANVDIENDINDIEATVDLNLGGDITVANRNTGSGSTNAADAEIDNDFDLVNVNAADIQNEVNIVANTGLNESHNNNGCNNCGNGCETCGTNGNNSDISSGDVKTDVTIENNINNISTDLDLDLGGDTEVANSNTGCGSDNTAAASVSNNVSVVNTNSAAVANTVNIISNTGGNSANGNSGGTNTATGGSQISFGITNNANNTSVNQ